MTLPIARPLHVSTSQKVGQKLHWGRSASSRRRRIRSDSSFATTSDAQNSLVASTQKWFQTVVLQQKLCPFAGPLVSGEGPGKMRIVASSAGNPRQAAADVTAEATFLMRTTSDTDEHHPETTLVVFDHERQATFLHDFREFVRLSWTLQEESVLAQGLENQLQLVLFHPYATHNTYGEESEESAADYTIRAPYPTVHLLREIDVARAVQSGYPHLEELPNRNKAKLIAEGLEACQKRLKHCYTHSTDDGSDRVK